MSTQLRTPARTALARAIWETDLPQTEVAAQLGVSASCLNNWCRGIRSCPDEHRAQLAAILNWDEAELFDEAPC